MIVESRFVASALNLDDFKHGLDALANRCGARRAAAIAFLSDGATPLWKLAEERFPTAVHIQDFWHVSEHLHGLAKTLLNEATEAARQTGKDWCEMLYDGDVGELIELLEGLRRRHRGAKRASIESELAYLRAGRHRMDYKRFREQGWPIGSGAIEATCKHLVKERLGATGARWRRANLPHIMALRVCRANGEWDKDFTPSLRAA
jgi:hypothetical protein